LADDGVLDLIEGRQRMGPSLLNLDDVPAELGSAGSEISPSFSAKAASSKGFSIFLRPKNPSESSQLAGQRSLIDFAARAIWPSVSHNLRSF
jgi:hypothetical protein